MRGQVENAFIQWRKDSKSDNALSLDNSACFRIHLRGSKNIGNDLKN